VRSLCKHVRKCDHTVKRLHLQLCDVVDVANTSASGYLSSIRLVPIQLCINLLCDLWKWVSGVGCPEEIFGVKVIGLLGFLGWSDGHPIKLEFEAVRYQSLISPSVSQDGDEVNVAV
jgi:hypothetical protein